MRDNFPQHRIIILDTSGGLGGPSTFLWYFLKYLSNDKFKPILAFYFYNTGPDTEKIRGLGVPIIFLSKKPRPASYAPIKWLLTPTRWHWLHRTKVALRTALWLVLIELPQVWRLLSILKKERINLIVLNNDVHYNLVGAVAAKISGIPCICRKAGGIGEGKSDKRYLTLCVDLFIAISKATALDQLENNPSTKRLVTIYEGIDLKKFSPTPKIPAVSADLGIPWGKKVVGCIGRITPGKGQKEFVEAAAEVVKRYKDVVFLIVGDDVGGDGLSIDDLKAKAALLGLKDYVVFTGWRTDIAQILSSIDIFVHCPTTSIEGLGLANLEAMAMGKPTVVSDNGGLRDAVVNGVTGFIVPPGDIQRMGEAILTLLENEALASELGRNARERVIELFDIEKNTRKLEELFEEYASTGV